MEHLCTAKSLDGNLYFSINDHILSKCGKALVNKSEARQQDLEYASKILKALKKIPKLNGQYIYKRFFNGKVLTQRDMAKLLNIKEGKCHCLNNDSYRLLCEQMLKDELEKYELTRFQTIEELYSDQSGLLNSIQLKGMNSNVESYEILGSVKFLV